MKIIRYFILVLFGMSCLVANAIKDSLAVSNLHTMVLDFNSEIKYVDFGSAEVFGSKLSSGRMLRVQAKVPNFKETTLSVVTGDGKYYEFKVYYEKHPNFVVWNNGIFISSKDTIGVSSTKTIHFLCDDRISDLLVGSNNIIAAYARDIENIVKIKALQSDFDSTSFVVITESGIIYPFLLIPNQDPLDLSVQIATNKSTSKANSESSVLFKNAAINNLQMQELGEKVFSEKQSINNIGIIKQRMCFSLSGIYCKDDVLLFRLNLTNNNSIDYEIDFIKVYVKDKKIDKKTAVQEEELFPIYVYYSNNVNKSTLKGDASMYVIFFMKRFTLPPNRILYFEVFEKNGGRHLRFPVSDVEILKARNL
ncbi:MAG: conjugative transposon protein TraN [Bacteroidia bacterium]|nr:conjugative transposon protein TraN [Bacteroidia bacterium]